MPPREPTVVWRQSVVLHGGDVQSAGMPVDLPANAELEGTDTGGSGWGDFAFDEMRVRADSRTVFETLRRIKQGIVVMNPDFQRDFVWPEATQSKLIESVIMRIPLPVFYAAENDDGHMVVVDGLQRLHTFVRFVSDELRLALTDRDDLNRKRFSDLPPRLQNRVEDCNLRFYIIDSRMPERARLDIFERVNSGTRLTRQQMRNCMFMGPATRFLKEEAETDLFRTATDSGLSTKAMRDRELINRFCAFQTLGHEEYRGDMDGFLAECLRRMNKCPEQERSALSRDLRRSLANNTKVFGKDAFRRQFPDRPRRSVINAALWDVMSTGLSRYPEDAVAANRKRLLTAVGGMLADPEFEDAITKGTNDAVRVSRRFERTRAVLKGVFDADAD